MRPAPERASSSRRPATSLPTTMSWEILRKLKSGSPTAQNSLRRSSGRIPIQTWPSSKSRRIVPCHTRTSATQARFVSVSGCSPSGNPFGLERTVTLGVVSGIGRENMNLSRYENFIQTDASINPGNSGGPLFNLRGEIIGINTAIINFAQGIGFAIPSNMAKQVLQQLLEQGRVVRGWLGVGIQPLTPELARKFGVPEQEGVLVNEVFEKDPAAAAGIKAGDVITRIEGSVIDSPNRLSRIVAGLLPGAKAHVEVVRNQERIVVEVALTERRDHATVASLPQSRSESKLGVDVQDLTAALAEKFKLRESHGVLVTKVEPGSLAQSEGLREGDLIKEVNRADVGTVGDFTRAVAKVRRGDTVLLRVLRESRAFYVVLKPNEP